MKKEAALPTPDVVKLNIKGFSMDDTLEFVHEGAAIATAAANQGFDQTVMMPVRSGKDSIAVRKKGDTKTIGHLQVNASPFFQSKKVYFDGTTVTDNVELTPVSNPANMGFQASFKTAYPYFYGGPVNIELFVQEWDMNTFEISYHPLNITIPAVGGSFSGFTSCRSRSAHRICSGPTNSGFTRPVQRKRYLQSRRTFPGFPILKINTVRFTSPQAKASCW